MTETADFRVRVIDDSTKNALKIQASLKSVESQLKSLDRAAAKAKGPEAMKRFGLNEQRSGLFGQQRAMRESVSRQRAAVRQQVTASRAAERQQAKAAKAAKAAKKESDAEFGAAGFSPLKSLAGVGGVVGAAAAGAFIVKEIVMAVVDLGKQFIATSLDAAKFAQDSKFAFGTLTGSASVGISEFKRVREEAAIMGLDVRESIGGYRRLLAARFDVPLAGELQRMSADLSITGANVDKAILAISQIKMKGVLQGEELTGQLAEAGVSADSVYRELGKRLGKTRKEILKLQKTGGIKADVAIAAIMQSVKTDLNIENFGDLAKERAKTTLSGMSGAFGAKVENMWIDIGEAMTPGFTRIAGRVFGLFDTLAENPKVKAMGDNLLIGFNRFSKWVDGNWPAIESKIVTGVEFVSSTVSGLTKIATLVADGWETVGPIVTGWASVVGSAMFAVLNPIAAIGIAFTATTGIIVSQIGEWTTAGANLVQGLIDGIDSKVASLKAKAIEVASIPITWTKVVLQEHSPSKAMFERGELATEGFIGGIGANDNAIRGVTAGMGAAAIAGAGDAAALGAGGSGAGIRFGDINVTVTTTGTDGETIGQDIARVVRKELRKELESYEAA